MTRQRIPRPPFRRDLLALLRRLAADRRGVTAAFTGMSLMMLMGFVGLGTEVSSWYVTKRSMQGAADAAAFSAATAASASGSYSTEGTAVAATFGYVSGVHSVTVAINNPPKSGPYAGVSSAYEAVISQPQTQLFSKLFMATPATVAARAVATGGSQPQSCIVTLSSSDSAGITINGNDTVTLTNCVVRDNATGPESLLMNGSGAKLSAEQVFLGGEATTKGGGTISTTEGLLTDQSAIADPYAGVNFTYPSGETPGTCDFTNLSVLNGVKTLTPNKIYCGGITIAGGTVTLPAGVYILDRGSFSVTGNATVTGSGVTIVLTSSTGKNYGTVTINGSTTVTLSPPTTGPLAGIVFFQDRNAPDTTNVTINGGSRFNVTGVMYFSTASVTFNGQGSATCTELVAATVTLNGTSSFGGDCSGVPGVKKGGSASVKLVE